MENPILYEFAKKLYEEQIDLEPEFSEIIDEHFDELF